MKKGLRGTIVRDAGCDGTPTHLSGGCAKDMDLAEAESAALTRRSRPPRTSVRLADVEQPRDSVTEWEDRVRDQFAALKRFAKKIGCTLKQSDLPPGLPGATPGREVTVYLDSRSRRVWKATFPGEAGFGQFGYYTPEGICGV